MTKPTWLDEEPGAGVFLRQTLDLLRHGLRRPWLTLAVAALLATLVAGGVALSKRHYAPRFVLRLTEANGDPSGMQRPKRQLAAYVREGVFTHEPLFSLIRRHDLYPTLARNNPRAAVASFREDIDVDVYQNYFVEARAAGEQPRSARVAVSYHSTDRATALAVTRELGALIVRHETRARLEQAKRSASDAERTVLALQNALQRRAGEISVKRNEIARASEADPRLQVELVGLMGSVGALERQTDAAERRAAALDLGEAFERRGMGLVFNVAEDASLPSGAGRVRSLLLIGCLSFLLGLPLAALTSGVLDTRSRT